jgi:hypothetical protein
MRFMVIVKASPSSEAGVQPSEKALGEMMAFNQELAASGMLLGAEGLLASSKGARIRYSGDKRTVLDGPFTETKDLVAGFWLIQAKSLAEVVDMFKRCPNPMEGPDAEGAEIEIRQAFDPADFENATPEMIEQEQAMRAKASAGS